MVTISLCMIVKNEEEVLARCLESVADVVDEIIIVDTGSTDKTKEIASRFTDKIYDFIWVDDFSKARNMAYSKAQMDYQMWLDADDVLLEREKEKLITLKKTITPDVDMVIMKYDTSFDSQGNPVLTSQRERMTRTDKNYRWEEPVHECIPISGNIMQTDITITHKKNKQEKTSDRNIKIYQAIESAGTPLTPRQVYYFARELKDHQQYAKAAYYFEKFLSDGKGWIEDNIGACFSLSVCYHMLGEEEKRLAVLTKSFLYDAPRAEICTEIGYYYKKKKEYETAVRWFLNAVRIDKPNTMGFVLQDYWGYIPNLELCVCYASLGDMKKAEYYNEEAGKFKKEDSIVQKNKRYFQKK